MEEEKIYREKVFKIGAISIGICLLIAYWYATQGMAADCDYSKLLGSCLNIGEIHIYAPYKYYFWQQDVELNKAIPEIIGSYTAFPYLGFVIGAGFTYACAKSMKKETSHGSAAFATAKEIDETGLGIYEDKIVEVIRSFSSRFWDKEKKEWEIPFKYFKSFIDALSDYDFDITGQYVSTKKKKVTAPSGFEFKTKPFEHQIEGFEYGLNNDRWLLGDEQGLGKTKQVIDIAVAKKLQKGYKHCLIICGVNGLKWNWDRYGCGVCIGFSDRTAIHNKYRRL